MSRIDTRKWAEFYATTQRTAQRWVKALQPIEHPEAMAKIILADPRSSAPSRIRATEILAEAQAKGFITPPAALTPGAPVLPGSTSPNPRPPGYEDSDWKAFMESAEDIETADATNQLVRLRSFYAYKLEAASKAGDVGGIKLYTEQVINLENAINRNKLMAKKLGIDAGELMKRDAVEQFLDAFTFTLMRGIDDALAELCHRTAGLTYPEEIRPIMEDYLLSTRLLAPFRDVVEQASGLGLPAWFVDKLITAAESHIEGARPRLTPPDPPAREEAAAPIAS